jgi:hypothetical protein
VPATILFFKPRPAPHGQLPYSIDAVVRTVGADLQARGLLPDGTDPDAVARRLRLVRPLSARRREGTICIRTARTIGGAS